MSARNSSALGRIADIVIAGAAIPFAAVLLLALSRLAPERTTAHQWLVFYVLPVVVIIGLVVVWTRSESVRTNVALLMVAAGAGGALIQFVLAVLPDPGLREGAAGADANRETVVEVARRLRTEGIHAYPRLSAPEVQQLQIRTATDTIQPVSPAPGGATTVLCNETGDPLFFTTGPHGFRNAARPDTTASLVLIGDSFTHGVCVPDEGTIAGHLRNDFPSVRNLGTLGAGPLTELAILREFAAPDRPAVVVWMYYEGNDVIDLQRESFHATLPRYLDPAFSQDLINRQADVSAYLQRAIDSMMDAQTPIGEIQRPGFFSRLRQTERIRGVIRFGVSTPSRVSRLGSFPQVMAEAQRAVQGWGGELIFVYLPAYRRYHMWLGGDLPEYRETVAVAESLGIRTVDLVAEFSALERDPRSLWTGPAGHLSVEGYGVVADLIRNAISTDLRSGIAAR